MESKIPAHSLSRRSSSESSGSGRSTPVLPMDHSSAKGVFGWSKIQGIDIPHIFRNGIKYFAVRIVECKLLSDFMDAYPEFISTRPRLISHYITQAEAKLLNEINMVHCGCEYSRKPFDKDDLIVKVSEFVEYYESIRQHHETSVAERAAATNVQAKTQPVGGWVQINNTVLPFLYRGGVQYVPLAVVKYAAGLLTESQITGTLVTEIERDFFNKMCSDSGVQFKFSRKAKVVALPLVQTLCKRKATVTILPDKNPLVHASYNWNVPNVGRQQLSGSELKQSHRVKQQMRTMTSSPRTQPVAKGNSILPVKEWAKHIPEKTSVQSTANFQVKGEAPTTLDSRTGVNTHVISTENPILITPVDEPMDLSVSCKQPQSNTEPSKGIITETDRLEEMVRSIERRFQNEQESAYTKKNVDTASAIEASKAATVTQKHTVSWFGNGNMQLASSLPKLNGMDPAKPVSLPSLLTSKTTSHTNNCDANSKHLHPMQQSQITRIKFQGKTLSVLMRPSDRQAFVLIEVLSKVFFPSWDFRNFEQALSQVLRMPIFVLTPDEEHMFVSHYGLPTDRLECNKVVQLQDFQENMGQLLYIFKTKSRKRHSVEPDEYACHEQSDAKCKRLSAPGKLQYANKPFLPEGNQSGSSSSPDFVIEAGVDPTVQNVTQFSLAIQMTNTMPGDGISVNIHTIPGSNNQQNNINIDSKMKNEDITNQTYPAGCEVLPATDSEPCSNLKDKFQKPQKSLENALARLKERKGYVS